MPLVVVHELLLDLGYQLGVVGGIEHVHPLFQERDTFLKRR